MQSPPELRDEARRLSRLHQLQVLDTGPEAVLDHLTELAAAITGMPIALISLIDHDRQWFKAAVGLDQGGQTPRSISFCGHAIASDELFEVKDAHADPRFADNPLVAGDPRIAHYAGMPLVMPAGERIGTLCVISDQPGQLTAKSRRILKLLADSVVSVLLLRESNRRKDEFLAMLAHELRNPLAPITTAAHLLKLSPQPAPRTRELGDLINRQVSHMTELVDDLLDISRVTRGITQIERSEVDLRDVIHDALEQTRPQVQAHGHSLDVEVPQQPLPVEGDRVRLVQVLANILTNACKYTPDRGHIHLKAWGEADQVVVSVRDNGQGIDPQMLPRVFELFTQARRTPERTQGGLGVGLALVRALVELHGGTVQAHSAGPGQGSTFTVRLLRLRDIPSPTGAPPDGSTTVTQGRPLQVVVVDDNVDASQMLQMWLQAHGHAVRVFQDAGSALASVAQEPADVYLLDIGLPGMSGLELARRLRLDPRNRQATLIALTGYGQSSDILNSRQAGFDHHFVKPTDPLRLLAVLDCLRAATAGAPTAVTAAQPSADIPGGVDPSTPG